MSDSAEPRWDLLPHEPEQFFELPEEFDRKDLKRRYNALLRQFKPEKHPEEFQKIRAAFELLDNQLRYGEERTIRGGRSSPQTFDWSQPISSETGKAADSNAADRPTESPSPDGSDESREERPLEQRPSRPIKPREKSALERLRVRLQSETPAQIYQQLEEEPNKTPFDFFTLAILSDIAKPDASQTFLKWLLRGLAKHPDDPGLTRLLSTYLHSKLPLSQLPAIAQAVAKAIPNDRFYAMTETLWDRMLQAQPFEQVAKLLSDCEGLLRDHRLDGKLTFYVHILKRAIWLADEAWIDTAFELLEEHGSELEGRLEYDFEFLMFLRRYRDERKTFLNGTAGREMIDQAMQDYCLKSDYDADRAVLECQLALATEQGWLREAFPNTDDTFPAWWTLWNWITADVADRMAEQDSEVDADKLFQQLRKVLRRCEQTTDKSWLGWRWGMLGWAYLFVIAVSLLALCLPAALLGGNAVNFVCEKILKMNSQSSLTATGFAAAFWAVVTGVAYFMFLRERTAHRLRRWMATRLGKRSYQRQWRTLIEQHLSLTHQPFHLLIEQLAVEHDDISQVYTSWIHAHASSDYGLACLAMSQQFLR
jgi:hypothetical protein